MVKKKTKAIAVGLAVVTSIGMVPSLAFAKDNPGDRTISAYGVVDGGNDFDGYRTDIRISLDKDKKILSINDNSTASSLNDDLKTASEAKKTMRKARLDKWNKFISDGSFDKFKGKS